MYFEYVLSKRNGKFYIGQTKDLEDRLKRHNSGRETYKAPYMSWEIRLSMRNESRAEAMDLEMLKQCTGFVAYKKFPKFTACCYDPYQTNCLRKVKNNPMKR